MIYGDFLEQFEWSHFGTLTFDWPTSPAGALQQFSKWISRIEKPRGQEIPWFGAVELGESNLAHVHTLIYTQSSVKILRQIWGAGVSHVVPYDPRKAATHYVTKDILLRSSEYDISSVLRKRTN